MTQQEQLLEVENLNIIFPSSRGDVHAVKDVSFSVGKEKIGIVGESGSGKSITGRSILRLLPPYAKVSADKISLKGQDILSFSEKQMRTIRGREISMVMQDPKYSLNPVRTVGEQIGEAYIVHHKASKKEAFEQTLKMLTAVRIRNPEQVYRLYPHEVSGGMGQRIMIAMMLIPEPSLLIADEPTSALDVTVQLQVLAILDDLVDHAGFVHVVPVGEDHALDRAELHLRRHDDLPAPRLDLHHVAVPDAQALRVLRVDLDERVGVGAQQFRHAHRHRARVPVLHDAAGGQV